MKLKVEIDPGAGFCRGVVKAIDTAEYELQQNNELYCLGDIVHNGKEVERLSKLGLITINNSDLLKIKNKKVLLRAHGEPPITYDQTEKNNITIIDATCPVVLGIQKKIKKGYLEMKQKNGQIAIFGKEGHAEVIGLLGQTNNEAILIKNINGINQINYDKPLLLFSQTTKELDEYNHIQNEIEKRYQLKDKDPKEYFTAYKTICNHVVKRKPGLIQFCKQHDVIIFVSGKKSSNGKILFDACKQFNDNAYFVTNSDDLKFDWFKNLSTVGISGATSTPKWLMEEIKIKIESYNN